MLGVVHQAFEIGHEPSHVREHENVVGLDLKLPFGISSAVMVAAVCEIVKAPVAESAFSRSLVAEQPFMPMRRRSAPHQRTTVADNYTPSFISAPPTAVRYVCWPGSSTPRHLRIRRFSSSEMFGLANSASPSLRKRSAA